MALMRKSSRDDHSPDHREQSAEQRATAEYRKLLVEEIDLEELSTLSVDQRRIRLERVMNHLISREGPVLAARDRQRIIRLVVDEALGLGIIEPLLADPSVTEIMVNGYQDIFVERRGRLEKLELAFSSPDQLMQTIDRVVAGVNRRVDESSPMVDARLATGERVNVIVPPLALNGPTLTIRRFPTPFTLHDLIGKGSLDATTAELLAQCVAARMNIVVSGGTGTGKTTMLNALSGLIDGGDRIVTIEDSAELQLQQPHVVRLESRPPNVEGKGQVTIRDLVRNSLRMRPDRIIVGEVRGGETLDMLQAMNTGHDGSLVTVHANTAIDAVSRLETLASMSELQIPYAALRDQINSALDLVVQVSRWPDGSRRISEIACVTSKSREEIRLQPVMRFLGSTGADRRTQGAFRIEEIPTVMVERLHQAGLRVPRGLTARESARLMSALITLAIALVLILGVVGVLSFVQGTGEKGDLVREISGGTRGTFRAERLVPFDAKLRRTRWGARLHLLLEQANLRRLLSFEYALIGIGTMLLTLIGSLQVMAPLWAIILTGLVGYIWVSVLRGLRRRQYERFIGQLPELSRILANATGAGLSINSAMRIAGAELADPAGREISVLNHQLEIGVGIDEAFERLAERVPGRDLAVLVSTLVISHRTGGSLITALRGLSTTLEERKETSREVRTLVAESSYTGYMVAGLGVALIVLLSFIEPTLLNTLTTTIPGQIALVIAGASYVFGILLIRRLTRVKL